jgi:hypothetical protein
MHYVACGSYPLLFLSIFRNSLDSDFCDMKVKFNKMFFFVFACLRIRLHMLSNHITS